jgi:hypothetical protein
LGRKEQRRAPAKKGGASSNGVRAKYYICPTSVVSMAGSTCIKCTGKEGDSLIETQLLALLGHVCRAKVDGIIKKV